MVKKTFNDFTEENLDLFTAAPVAEMIHILFTIIKRSFTGMIDVVDN